MDRKTATSIAIMFILHLVGWLGIVAGSWREMIISLTPANLLICLLLILWNRKWESWDAIRLPLLFLGGFFIELIGVQTGLVFGTYEYGPPFGIQIGDTPILIGVNWLLLLLASSAWVQGISSVFARSAVAATIMVILDLVLEPVAMTLDFWQWKGDVVPLQNYLAWWVVAFAFQIILQRRKKGHSEPVARAFLVIQFLFFVSILLFL